MSRFTKLLSSTTAIAIVTMSANIASAAAINERFLTAKTQHNGMLNQKIYQRRAQHLSGVWADFDFNIKSDEHEFAPAYKDSLYTNPKLTAELKTHYLNMGYEYKLCDREWYGITFSYAMETVTGKKVLATVSTPAPGVTPPSTKSSMDQDSTSMTIAGYGYWALDWKHQYIANSISYNQINIDGKHNNILYKIDHVKNTTFKSVSNEFSYGYQFARNQSIETYLINTFDFSANTGYVLNTFSGYPAPIKSRLYSAVGLRGFYGHNHSIAPGMNLKPFVSGFVDIAVTGKELKTDTWVNEKLSEIPATHFGLNLGLNYSPLGNKNLIATATYHFTKYDEKRHGLDIGLSYQL